VLSWFLFIEVILTKYISFMKTITITAAKVATMGAIFMVATSVALVAYAAVSITTATLSDSTVAPGESVTVDVTASKTGGGCANNWC
jgi:hypothetical protein